MQKGYNYDKFMIKDKLFSEKVRISNNLKKDFPIFKNNKKLIYLDNAATTQKPNSVLKNYIEYYEKYNSNIHRGIYDLSEMSSLIYEYSKENISNFFNINSEELVFTKGTTDSLNQISRMLESKCELNDEILITIDQHHSNLIPWQKLSQRKGMNLKFVYLDENFEIDNEDLLKKISQNTKIIVLSHVSNVTGKIHPIKEIVETIKDSLKIYNNSLYFVIDGAQAVAHLDVDINDLNVDFYAFSSHKMYGPMGIGGFYINKNIKNDFEPVIYGGDAIEDVTELSVKYLEAPQKYEPGTQNVAGAYGLSLAVDFLRKNRKKNSIEKKEKELFNYLYDSLLEIEDIKIIGDKKNKISLLTFSHKKIHSHDLSYYLSTNNIAVRSGMHCAYPLYKKYNLESSIRVSIGCYNTKKEIDYFIKKIKDSISFFNNLDDK
ncbi:MAG: aminotransferase class V-fold PLP-dependent enzyme [Candidatus Nanoarchaeia archaeon]|nr:aminotransferase class V-fold PLP-dependent enzyme [Candidatus Nanoarchaeia archaeon]